MGVADYRGARGSLAGTSFHELWALNQAMRLLDSRSDLSAVAVEGFGQNVKSSDDRAEYDGVDCTLLYGDPELIKAKRIEIAQLKYSGSQPHSNWTLSRLTKSDKKNGNNSVLRRLASAFKGLTNITSAELIVRLVSNQDVSAAVTENFQALGSSKAISKPIHEKTRKATGLTKAGLTAFAKALDLTSQTGSRFQLEEELLLQISRWTDDDARSVLELLLGFIRKQMAPENVNRLIFRESMILMIAGSPSEESLFPCPSDFVKPRNPVLRDAARDLADELRAGTANRLCLHGGAGSGKTTVLQQSQQFLPGNSILIAFDSYGGGRYLDAARVRHRAGDAFVQLCNQMATQMALPLFLTKSDKTNARSFLKRLLVAAKSLVERDVNALLIVAVDAADNSITAARHFGERSFVEDLISIGDLPANVRILLSCRTGRLSELKLPADFKPVPLSGFTLGETAKFVRLSIPNATQDWIDDFHQLAGGVPRVENYALQNGTGIPEGPLSLLQPSGKTLNVIFEGIFLEALQKFGLRDEFEVFCAALIALPRPIPLAFCAATSGMAEGTVRDLCWDLAPGLRLENDAIAFADEDIEEFIRDRAASKVNAISDLAATLLWKERTNSDYAATHVASILFRTGRKDDLIKMIETDPEATSIGDPLRRREVRLQRVKLGLKLANDTADIPSVLRTALSGAEAVRSDDAISNLLESNLDLAVSFAEDSVTRRVLLNGSKMPIHGSLIAQLMLKNALANQPTAVRSYSRQFRAWLLRRDLVEEHKENDFGRQDRRWNISDRDVAAVTEAWILIAGAKEGLTRLLSWTPRSLALRVAELVVPHLLARGRSDLVIDLLNDPRAEGIFACWLIVPLAMGGLRPSIAHFKKTIRDPRIRRLVKLSKPQFGYGHEAHFNFFDKILCTCELSAASLSSDPSLTTTLQALSAEPLRSSKRLWAHDTDLLNILIRAYCLLCAMNGAPSTVLDFLKRDDNTERIADDREREQDDALKTIVSILIGFYSVRAKLLLNEDGSAKAAETLREAAKAVRGQEYRVTPHGRSRLYELLMASISDLAGFQNADAISLLKTIFSVRGDQTSDTGHEFLPVLHRLVCANQTHNDILQWVSERDKATSALRCTAAEKIEAYLSLARLAQSISLDDAQVLFRHAHEATEEIDVDCRHQLRALCFLINASNSSLTREQKRKMACDLATLVSNAALSVGDEKGFPWIDVSRTLAKVDPAVALAAAGRWEDCGLVSRSETLEIALEEIQFDGRSSAILDVSLNCLLESDTLSTIALEKLQRNDDRPEEIIEDLCRDALLFDFGRSRQHIAEELAKRHTSGIWQQKLVSTVAFIESRVNPVNASASANRGEEEPPSIVSVVPGVYTSTSEISGALQTAKGGERWVRTEEVLSAIQTVVTPANRLAHLRAMLAMPPKEVSCDELVRYFESVLKKWPTIAVTDFVAGSVPILFRTRLPELTGFLTYGEEHTGLDRLIALSDSPGACIQPLIEGLGASVDVLDAGTLYEVCGRLAALLVPDDIKKALAVYTERLLSNLPTDNSVYFDGADIPLSTTDALARYLYALMSDIEVGTRWRAAHCLRRLVRYGDAGVLASMAALWPRTVEVSFRDGAAPFYWQAARLWLVITLSRIVVENPNAVVPSTGLLLNALRDVGYPHPAVRSFAQDALRALNGSGAIELNKEDRIAVETANTNTLPRVKRARSESHRPARGKAERRFDFNPIDTIPYWFQPTVGVFQDLTVDDLRDEAERWIVDRWNVDPEYSKWKAEPRQKRFPERSWSLRSNDHGSHPKIEDYRTFLEWYSLQCSVGSLMASHPLASSPYDDADEDEFESRLQRQKLTEPPYWLADLLLPKPCERRFWDGPPDEKGWQNGIADADFLLELKRGSSDSDLVVSSWVETTSSNFSWSASVSSALVDPANALALVRALQTADEPMDYKLPEEGDFAGDRFDIDDAGFQLKAWTRSLSSESQFDDSDPLSFDIDRTRDAPAGLDAKPQVQPNGVVFWPRHNGIVFSYERWKNRRDTKDEQYRGPDIKTDGHRLFASAAEILAHLEQLQMDLIFEIRITRRRGGDSYQTRKEEKHLELEGRFDGIVLLRADGSLHTADGCIGSWPISG